MSDHAKADERIAAILGRPGIPLNQKQWPHKFAIESFSGQLAEDRDWRERLNQLDDKIEKNLRRIENKHQRELKNLMKPLVAKPGEKVTDPKKYPLITVPEAMIVFAVTRSTIYRWIDEGKLKRAHTKSASSTRGRVLILTRSAKKLLKESLD